MDENRQHQMTRIVNAFGKLNRGRRAYAVLVLCATTAVALPAQTFTTLFSFDNTHGATPEGSLVQATNGYLYGTTFGGGTFNYGTVFKITPSGTLTTLYGFAGYPTDGAYPVAGLVQATNGAFYGTTWQGGPNAGGNGDGPGTIFKITPSGTLTTLYSFCSQSGCTDGEFPGAGLVQATNGALYGTTGLGGANGEGGTVFRITRTLTTLYSFCSQSGCTDGEWPNAGLIQATNGDFYGTTWQGGANGGAWGDGAGTVFKITPSGKLTTLYSFCSQSGCTDGENPYYGALVQATNGDLYGTTWQGGASGGAWGNGAGTVFKISPSGKLTTLYSFCSQSGCTDGENPFAGLVQDTNGKFYGTTNRGGANGAGTVFSLSVGLGPFVETRPTSGLVGKAVKILGTSLTGATSVSFNGTAATFTVVSAPEIP